MRSSWAVWIEARSTCNGDAFRVSDTDSKQIENASLLYVVGLAVGLGVVEAHRLVDGDESADADVVFLVPLPGPLVRLAVRALGFAQQIRAVHAEAAPARVRVRVGARLLSPPVRAVPRRTFVCNRDSVKVKTRQDSERIEKRIVSALQ